RGSAAAWPRSGPPSRATGPASSSPIDTERRTRHGVRDAHGADGRPRAARGRVLPHACVLVSDDSLRGYSMTDHQSTPAIVTSGAAGQVEPFPTSFRTQHIPTNGTTLFVRIGGAGPAVLLLHGYGETGDMWAPLAAHLAPRYTVIVPDLRGMGLSARPAGGY